MTESKQNAKPEEDVQPRWKSWAVWAAFLGATGLLLQALGLLEKLGLTDESWNALISAVGALLTALGIVNNPTDASSL